MTSNEVKAAFKNAGLSVRVRDLGRKFRICTLGDAVFTDKAKAIAIAASLRLTDSSGNKGAQFNQPQELICYKHGAIVRL